MQKRICTIHISLHNASDSKRRASLTPGFQHYVAVPVSVPVSVSVAVSVAVSVTVSVETVSVPAVPYAVAGACARQ